MQAHAVFTETKKQKLYRAARYDYSIHSCFGLLWFNHIFGEEKQLNSLKISQSKQLKLEKLSEPEPEGKKKRRMEAEEV